MSYFEKNYYSNQYPALKVVISCFRAMGYITLAGTTFFLINFYPYYQDLPSAKLIVIGIITGAVLISLLLFAFGEFFKILVDIERNTNSNFLIKDSIDGINKNIEILIFKQMDNEI